MLAQSAGDEPVAGGQADAAGGGPVGSGKRAAWSQGPWCTELQLKVLACGEDAAGPWVDLPDSLLYPGGGGQPTDRGWLAGRAVVGVEAVDGGWRHHLSPSSASEDSTDLSVRGLAESLPIPGNAVLLRLDWARRFDHMQQHSGQHLLSAIAEDRFGWRTTSFHLGPELCDIELDVPALVANQLRVLEEAVVEAIRSASPIRDRWVEPEALPDLRVRSRGLPAGHRGLVRLVEIEGFDLATCGGTHLSNLAQLEGLALVGTESMRGGTRLHWLAGSRIRRRLARQEEQLAALRRRLKAPDDELAESVTRLLTALEEERQLARSQAAWIVETLAGRLKDDARPWPWLHEPRLDRDLQRELGKQLLAMDRAAFLSGGAAPYAWLLVLPAASSAPRPPDEAALRSWIEDLGRGGGRAPFVQGQAEDLDRLVVAAERLAGWVGA